MRNHCSGAKEFSLRRAGGVRAAAIYGKAQRHQPRKLIYDNTLTKIAEGHPINKVDQLMPWQMNSQAAQKPCA